MARIVAFLLLCAVLPAGLRAQEGGETESGGFSYLIRPSFSFLMNTVQKPEGEALVLCMYGQLRSQFSFDVSAMHLKSYVNVDLSREAYSDARPCTMRDDLVVTAIPSVIISPQFGVSLFLELTMETKITNGTQQDGIPTRFMDPAFFYETLYIGQWRDWKSDDGSRRLSFRYGVGYAFQQTMRTRFLLTGERAYNLDPENPLSAIRQAPSVQLESGYSGIAALEYSGDLSENLTSFVEALGVTLSKKTFGIFSKESHVVCQLGAGLTYNVFSLRYDMRLMYDPNYSLRRQLDQTATFGIQLEFKN